MKKLIITVLLVCIAIFATAQDMSKHRLSIDLGGPVALATFEYQNQVLSKNAHALSLTVGVGTTFFSYSFPLGINYTYGDNNQMIVGIQYVPLYVSSVLDLGIFDDGSGNAFRGNIISPRLGYRKIMQGIKETYYVQFYFSPIIFVNTGDFIAWGGLGFGVSL